MKKQLFYYFFTTREEFNGIINNIHYTCLEHYKHVFDEVFICIALNDTEDHELIRMIQNKFLDIFNGGQQKITFKIIKNNRHFRECVFFHEEIIDKLPERDIVFFAHNKGLTNIYFENINKESLFHWIVGLYYASLQDIQDMMFSLTEDLHLTYGSFPTRCNGRFIYTGTFYWLNCKRIHSLYDKKYIMTDRFTAESYPTFLEQNNVNKLWMAPCSFHRFTRELNADNGFDYYECVKEYCKTIGYVGEDFYKLYNKAIKEEYFK
jgi:hypothetical protein